MFGIDFEALILLAVLAFILFGPEKLPEYAAKMGYYLAKLRAASADLNQQAQASFPNPLQPPAQPIPALSPALAAQIGINERPCPYCSHLVGDDFTFCPKCGQHLKAGTEIDQTANRPLSS